MNSSTDSFSSRRHGARWTLAAQSSREEILQLQTFLAARRDQPVSIVASKLRRADTILLQLFLSACRDWTARGLSFRLTGVNDGICSFLPLLGLQPDMIGIEVR